MDVRVESAKRVQIAPCIHFTTMLFGKARSISFPFNYELDLDLQACVAASLSEERL